MGRKIEFFHYLHDDGNVNENVEGFESSFDNNYAPSPNLGEVNYDKALSAVDKFYEDRPFYEIQVKVTLDVDSGEYTFEIVK